MSFSTKLDINVNMSFSTKLDIDVNMSFSTNLDIDVNILPSLRFSGLNVFLSKGTYN
jgi:hypothetical protein